MNKITMAVAALSVLLGATAAAETLRFDTSKYSQKPTGCDVLAAHPDDPNKVAPGVSQSGMDKPAAIAACEVAVAADPENPRLRYQLGRAYGYSGLGEKSFVHRKIAIAADYPQALFVNGYLHLLGENKAEKDPCRAGELLRRSAQYGRLAGQIGFPKWTLEGAFKGCAVKQDPAELLSFLEAADQQTGDFYTEVAIDLLKRQVQARMRNSR